MTEESIRDLTRTVPVLSKPFKCKIAFVGEAPGQQEEIAGLPFVGAAGNELAAMLREAGITKTECYFTNVFSRRTPGNKIETICSRKPDLPKDYDWPPISQGNYIRPEYLSELDRLYAELQAAEPNLVVCLGNVALWALSRANPKIGKLRGTIFESAQLPGQKCLATFHPAGVLRAWHQRTTCILDFIKAKHQGEYPEIRRPKRTIWIEPTNADLWNFYEQHVVPASVIGYDIETIPKRKLISCISLATSTNMAITVPFLNRLNKETYNYWSTPEEEVNAWTFVKVCLESFSTEKVTQNGNYDMQYLYRQAQIRPRNSYFDTMLKHHSMYPEIEKALDFLGSIYIDDVAWKTLRPRGAFSTTKRED